MALPSKPDKEVTPVAKLPSSACRLGVISLLCLAPVQAEPSKSNDASTPDGFALIPGGEFEMGDAFSRKKSAEGPVHTVSVDAFYIQETKVTSAQWLQVREWALQNGYLLSAGNAVEPSHPVTEVSWFDAVKWCNALSEKEGLTPCYTFRGEVLRNLNAHPECDWKADGYRLPTEAEWEKAARGGLAGRRYPWGDTISHENANYRSRPGPAYDVGPSRDFHPKVKVGGGPRTLPVGSFPANGHGLHDMVGNVAEFCWDWYLGNYYQSSPKKDPRGPEDGSTKVVRGGNSDNDGRECSVSKRIGCSPRIPYPGMGLRVVRVSSGPRS